MDHRFVCTGHGEPPRGGDAGCAERAPDAPESPRGLQHGRGARGLRPRGPRFDAYGGMRGRCGPIADPGSFGGAGEPGQLCRAARAVRWSQVTGPSPMEHPDRQVADLVPRESRRVDDLFASGSPSGAPRAGAPQAEPHWCRRRDRPGCCATHPGGEQMEHDVAVDPSGLRPRWCPVGLSPSNGSRARDPQGCRVCRGAEGVAEPSANGGSSGSPSAVGEAAVRGTTGGGAGGRPAHAGAPSGVRCG